MNISCKLDRKVPICELEKKWMELEVEAGCSFFLSWHWIRAWLVTYADKYIVVEAQLDGKIIGIGILTERTVTRNGLFRINQILLHRTGIEREDQIWIEFNDFLMVPEFSKEIRVSMLECVDKTLLNWDELVIGASENHVVDSCLVDRFIRTDFWNTNTYWVDLDYVRNHSENYLASLSSNTRSQIRRSIRLYEHEGDSLVVSKARDVEQALAFIVEAKPLHIQRWKGSERPSGFVNPEFESFHRTLISSCFDQDFIELYRISVGDKLIAVHYNFVYNGCVHFYLCAINYDNDNRLKPGLMSHALLIQQYIDRGLMTYDMMGGESRYKQSLSTSQSRLVASKVQRNRFQLRVENQLREFKNKKWHLFKKV